MKIAFLGNFQVPFSTESHHRWTWEKMGHTVISLQEGRATTSQILEACQNADLFQVTHTHGWSTPGTMSPEEMMERIKKMGVPSFSYHLDMYFGLHTLDGRADRVGQHWSWKVDHFFSTDGAHEDEYRARGINHHWLPPGVVEYGCHMGIPQAGQAADIGFVGSIGYHPEYPFRTQLVDDLRRHYGNRFRTYAGLREEPLNNAYASIKVVVGDHCFAGMPRYWSDRLPETCGRGGFLLYPKTEGMTIPTATYDPQNSKDLIKKIDYFLSDPHHREAIRREAFDHVKNHDTYTHRLSEVLRILGL